MSAIFFDVVGAPTVFKIGQDTEIFPFFRAVSCDWSLCGDEIVIGHGACQCASTSTSTVWIGLKTSDGGGHKPKQFHNVSRKVLLASSTKIVILYADNEHWTVPSFLWLAEIAFLVFNINTLQFPHIV